MKLHNIGVLEKVLLVLISKWYLFQEQLNWVRYLQLLDLFDAKAFSKFFNADFVGGKEYLNMWWSNLHYEGQELFMILFHQVIDVVKCKQELFGKPYKLSFYFFYFLLEFILVVIEALVKVIFLLIFFFFEVCI